MLNYLNQIERRLLQLEAKGVSFHLEGDVIKYRAPRGSLEASETVWLQSGRDTIGNILRARSAALLLKSATAENLARQHSYSQELWWRARGGPGEGEPFASNVTLSILVEELSIEWICRSIRELISEHEILMSRFQSSGTKLYMNFNTLDSFIIEYENLAPHSYSTELARKKSALFFSQLIPIEHSWLVRAKLFSFDDSRTLIAIGVNHIIFDGVSRNIVRTELKARLSGVYRGKKNNADLTFFDYSAHEREVIDSQNGGALKGYWEDWTRQLPKLKSPDSGCDLRWVPGTRSRISFVFPRAVFLQAEGIARKARTTPFVVYLTLLSLAISRWSGSGSVPIRALGDKRTTPELLGIVGLMYCADSYLVTVSNEDKFSNNLERVHSEYRRSLAMRFPTLQCFPPFLAKPREISGELMNEIPAAINYAYGAPSELDPQMRQYADWPPRVVWEQSQIWSRPMSPIFLQLFEQDSVLAAELQFNETLLSKNEQETFTAIFFRTFEENGLTS